MRKNIITTAGALLLGTCISSAFAEPFTYQGKLDFEGSPANGLFDFRVELYESNGNPAGISTTYGDIEVIDGLFTLTIDFPDDAFENGSGQTLLIGVREGDDNLSDYTSLLPRVEVGTVPVAQYALNSEVQRSGNDLLVGESQDRVLINPDLSNNFLNNTFTDFQLNFDRNNFGGMYINSESSTGIPFMGFSVDSNPLAYWYLTNNGQTDELPFFVGGFEPFVIGPLKVDVNTSLEVDGASQFNDDVTIQGDVKKEYNGQAFDIAPFAFGRVNSSGTSFAGTPNFNASWDSSSSRYVVNFPGTHYSINNFTAVANATGGNPHFVTTSSIKGNMLVYVYDINGNRVQRSFNFVVYEH